MLLCPYVFWITYRFEYTTKSRLRKSQWWARNIDFWKWNLLWRHTASVQFKNLGGKHFHLYVLLTENSLQILAEPSNGGRRCGALEEIQPCRSHDCELYKWHYSDWTPCYFDGANQCGTTTQHRTVRYRFMNDEQQPFFFDSVVGPILHIYLHMNLFNYDCWNRPVRNFDKSLP